MRWNPTFSSYTLKYHDNAVKKCLPGYGFGINWSIWDYEGAHKGDEYYMLRTGDDKAGIVFRGRFESDPYSGKDWKGSDRVRYYVDISVFDALSSSEAPHISIEELQEKTPSVNWLKGRSGHLLTEVEADALDALWEKNVEGIIYDDNEEIDT